MEPVVLIAAGESESAEQSVRWARLLALQLRAKMELLWCKASAEADEPSWLHAVCDAENCELRVAVGRPAEAIVQTAEELDASLVVMATHGRSGLDYWRHGSVTETVIRNAPCPVLVLTPAAEKEAPKVERLVVALDGSPFSERILRIARPYAEVLGVPVALTMIASVPTAYYPGGGVYLGTMDDLEAEATNYLKRIARPGEEVIARLGFPIEGLISITKPGDLLFVATHSRPRAQRFFLGSVAGGLMARSEVPLFVVNPHAIKLPSGLEQRDLGGFVSEAAEGNAQAASLLLNALTYDERSFRAVQQSDDPRLWRAVLQAAANQTWPGRHEAEPLTLIDPAGTHASLRLLLVFESLAPVEAVKTAALLDAARSEDSKLAQLAAELIEERLILGHQSSSPELGEALRKLAAGSGEQRVTAARIAALEPAEEAVPLLTGLLKDEDGTVRRAAEDALVGFGGQAVEPLLAWLGQKAPRGRVEALHALGRIASPSACEGMAALLADPDPEVAWAAGDALIEVGIPSVAPVLRTIATGPANRPFYDAAARVLKHLQTVETEGRLGPVLKALASPTIGVDAPPAADHALQLLKPRA